MLSNFIIWSTAAFGGTPFRLNKCTALGSAGAGAGAGAAVGGVPGALVGGAPGALVGGALGIASSLIGGLFGKHNTDKTNEMNYKIMQEQNRLLQEQFKAELENWRGFDAMYDARLKAFSLYNVMPQEVEKNVAQTMSFYASAFRDICLS